MAKIKLVEKAAPKCETFSPDTVAIGAQTWMKENLAVDDGGEGIYFNAANGEYYYSWNAAMRIAKSIPGWHLPTDDEWIEAAEVCGATPGSGGDYDGATELKSKLNIKLTGYRYSGSFYHLGSYAYFWTATEDSSTSAYFRYFSSGAPMVSHNRNKTSCSFSVRLVRD